MDISALAKCLNNRKIWDNCRDDLPYPYTEKDAEQFIGFVEGQKSRTITVLRSIMKQQEISVSPEVRM